MNPTASQSRLIFTMAVAMVVAVLLQVVFGALGPFLVADLGLSRTRLGLLTTAMYVSAAILSTRGGRVVDRWGARLPLLTLFGVMGASLLIVAGAPNYLLLVAGSLLAGVAIAIANPATNQMVQTSIVGARQGLVTGIKQSGIQVGVFVGSALLPLVAAASNWRVAVLTCLVPTALGSAITLTSVPKSSPRDGDVGQAADTELPLGTSWLATYAFTMGIGIASASAYLPLFGVEELGLAEITAGLLSAAVGGVAMVARLAWGQLADAMPSTVRWALTAMAILATAGALLLLGASSSAAWVVWLGAVVIGVSTAAWNGVAMLAVIRQAPPSVAGLASGVVLVGFYAGFAVGPLLFGTLVDVTASYRWGWGMVVLAAVLSCGLSLRWRRVAFAPPLSGVDATKLTQAP